MGVTRQWTSANSEVFQICRTVNKRRFRAYVSIGCYGESEALRIANQLWDMIKDLTPSDNLKSRKTVFDVAAKRLKFVEAEQLHKLKFGGMRAVKRNHNIVGFIIKCGNNTNVYFSACKIEKIDGECKPVDNKFKFFYQAKKWILSKKVEKKC